jgi:hypothetical protein
MNTSAQIRPHPNRELIDRTFELGYSSSSGDAVVTQLTSSDGAPLR